MDLVYFLDERLKFIKYLYEGSVATFAETKRKIEAGEEPYVDRRSYEALDGEPAFLSESFDAGDAIDMLGVTCLGMIVSALHSFLKEFVRENWHKGDLEVANAPSNGRGWLGRYQSFFEGPFRWERSGTDLEFLEQMTRVRNEDQHSRRLLYNFLTQSDDHASRHPNSAFRDRRPVMDAFNMIHVTPELLAQASDEVHRLCDFLDDVLIADRK